MAKLSISSIPAIKKLEIFSKRLVNVDFLGNYKSVFKGGGSEFEGFREYTSGDDAGLIDWKATLRANKTLIKEFSEERELNVFLLIDVGSTMVFGSTPKLKNEYAAELAASLCFAALKTGDAVGFALFSDRIIQKFSPVDNNKQFYLLLRGLVDVTHYGGRPNFENAIRFLLPYLKRSSVLIIISDFLKVGGAWEKMLKIASKKFDVIGIMVRDPRDRALPELNKPVLVEDPVSKTQLLIQPGLIRDEYRRYAAKQESRIKGIFRDIGAGFVSLSTDQDFSKPILRYFNKRIKEFR